MEDILQPLTEARDLMERLAAEEQRKSIERPPGAHVLRGPLLGRMEILKQVIVCGMEDMNLHLGEWGRGSGGERGGEEGVGMGEERERGKEGRKRNRGGVTGGGGWEILRGEREEG